VRSEASFDTPPSVSLSCPFRHSVTVSVLLCNYNHARYLADSLSAICNQTRLPEEVIVLDDGSSDNSLEVIEDFARRYSFIRVLKNEINRGLLYSINRTLNEARCDFIVWAAADDRLMPNFIERNVECLREYPTAKMTFSRLAVFRDGSEDIISFTKRRHGTAFDFGTAPLFLSPELLRNRLQQSYVGSGSIEVHGKQQRLAP
jgi:glycosyltransferase involved in cell wall biosynthesis